MSTTVDIAIFIVLILILLTIIYKYKNQTPSRKILPVTSESYAILERLKSDAVKIEPQASSLEFYSSDESYTEDKERVYLCLTDENGNYYPYNMLMNVLIHELSHAFTKVIDPNHTTPEFNNKFQQLLDKATEMGLYNPDEPLVNNYCPKHS